MHSYVFIEFRNADEATLALTAMNGHPFDAKHTFQINRFTDIERYADLDETYVEPEREEYHTKVRESYGLRGGIYSHHCVGAPTRLACGSHRA